MTDQCQNCWAEITEGGILKGPNRRLKEKTVEFVNQIDGVCYSELCQKCGTEILRESRYKVTAEIEKNQELIKQNIASFPMITLGGVPPGAVYKLKNLITANVTVGTGIFSEFSQGFSDLFGSTNSETGMAYKINSGESTARSILASKAMSMGANCVIGIDIDYGTTANNAATINMQGTAAIIYNLSDIMDGPDFARAQSIQELYNRIIVLRRKLNGDFETA